MGQPLTTYPDRLDRIARAVREVTAQNDGWPPTQRQLAVHLDVHLPTVNRWVKLAVKAGLVEQGGAGGKQVRVRKRGAA